MRIDSQSLRLAAAMLMADNTGYVSGLNESRFILEALFF